MFGQEYDGHRPEPARPSARPQSFSRSFSWLVTVFVFSVFICKDVSAQLGQVCDPECQARQAQAVKRFQTGSLGPGQDPNLLLQFPGVAAVLAADIAVTAREEHAALLAAALAAAAVPANYSAAPGLSSDMPPHCNILGVPAACLLVASGLYSYTCMHTTLQRQCFSIC